MGRDGVVIMTEVVMVDDLLFCISLLGKVVGLRYYPNVVHGGELVKLKPEPDNPYDGNAIAVHTINGDKLGHLPREIARELQGAVKAGCRFEARVPTEPVPARNGTIYSCAIEIDIFGDLPDQDEFVQAMNNCGVSVSGERVERTSSVTESTASKRTREWERANLDNVTDEYGRNTQLEELFPTVSLEKAESIPSDLAATLMDHQLEALWWMKRQEENPILPPIWEERVERSNHVYYCHVTKHSSRQRPRIPQGGILADDMGLGKTVSLLTLVLARKGATLVVCPLSVLSHWIAQLGAFAPSIKYAIWHGPQRGLVNLTSVDMVLTTYQTLASDFKTTQVLYRDVWERCVLDEGHIIRNGEALVSKACIAIRSANRWVLSGTIVHNRIADIQPILAFLGVEPLDEPSIFKQTIASRSTIGNATQATIIRLCLSTLALRRTKEATLRNLLPSRKIYNVTLAMEPTQERIYSHLFAAASAILFDNDHETRSSLFLGLLMRLRQAACSPALLPKETLELAESFQERPNIPEETLSKLLRKLEEIEDTDAVECAVCLDEPTSDDLAILGTCQHSFCIPCLTRIPRTGRNLCPLCRAPFQKKHILTRKDLVPVSKPSLEIGTGSKVCWLLQKLSEIPASESVVVFSQFRTLLEIVGREIPEICVMINGSVTKNERTIRIEKFQAGESRIALVTLGCGSTGLNLTRANHVVLLDPWWNSATEAQAMDRVYRIGQRRDVFVYRLIAESTIEAKIVELQQRKEAIAKGTVTSLTREEIMAANTLRKLFES